MDPPAETISAWSPFKQSVFRALWIATLVSNVGTWMQSVGAAWLMTSLSTSPALVALVQALNLGQPLIYGYSDGFSDRLCSS